MLRFHLWREHLPDGHTTSSAERYMLGRFCIGTVFGLEKGWSPQVSCGSIFGAARAHLLERPPLLG